MSFSNSDEEFAGIGLPGATVLNNNGVINQSLNSDVIPTLGNDIKDGVPANTNGNEQQTLNNSAVVTVDSSANVGTNINADNAEKQCIERHQAEFDNMQGESAKAGKRIVKSKPLESNAVHNSVSENGRSSNNLFNINSIEIEATDEVFDSLQEQASEVRKSVEEELALLERLQKRFPPNEPKSSISSEKPESSISEQKTEMREASNELDVRTIALRCVSEIFTLSEIVVRKVNELNISLKENPTDIRTANTDYGSDNKTKIEVLNSVPPQNQTEYSQEENATKE